jgi:hypothetical protein
MFQHMPERDEIERGRPKPDFIKESDTNALAQALPGSRGNGP